ncbi:ABC transporter ATP-binding protein [Parapusillimonas sp. SGNA-6]|nr:ABC transporter ATP-binding protein [Parapusillimonas sp. SGNA-6]
MKPLLEVRRIGRSFGALQAVQDVTFSVQPQELVGLIGPNGAGKSTLYNLLAGALPPSSGELIYQGRSIAGWKPYDAARAGIARTFQIPKPYAQMSVVENLMLSAMLHQRSVSAARDDAMAVLAEVHLDAYADKPVGFLSTGQLKRMEVGRALALKPKLVLFDEIMAGLTPNEINEMTELVKTLPGRGITVIWVEHVLRAIMSTVDRILVLNHGQLIADGSPEEVVGDSAVIQAYLGEETIDA